MHDFFVGYSPCVNFFPSDCSLHDFFCFVFCLFCFFTLGPTPLHFLMVPPLVSVLHMIYAGKKVCKILLRKKKANNKTNYTLTILKATVILHAMIARTSRSLKLSIQKRQPIRTLHSTHEPLQNKPMSAISIMGLYFNATITTLYKVVIYYTLPFTSNSV